MRNKAIYPGSFDPFTNGHLDIVKKAAELFDEVYVVIGVNAGKRRTYDCDRMKRSKRRRRHSEYRACASKSARDSWPNMPKTTASGI